MKVAIRADAAAAIGLGHVKRCLSLAQALRSRGAEVMLGWRRIDVDCSALIEATGTRSVCMADGPLHDAGEDARAFVAACGGAAAQLVVVDHYGLDAAWHAAVHAATGARLAAIDDLGDRALAVDTLIDPNLSRDPVAKFAGRLPTGCTLLTGPRHALLAPAYAHAARCEIGDTVRSIGIFMGGTDETNLSCLALDTLRTEVGFSGPIEIATTRGNPHLAALHDAAARDAALQVTLDQPDLAAFFARHVLHVGAGGGATWERCCIGAPTLAVIAAPNQREVLLPLQHLGVLRVLADEPPTRGAIATAARELIADPDLRRALAARSRELVDGLGAQRVATHLLAP